MQHIALTNPVYTDPITTLTLPALTPDNGILLLNGQMLVRGSDYERTGSVISINGDLTGERLDFVVLDSAAVAPTSSLTVDYLLLQMLMAINNLVRATSNSSTSSSSSSVVTASIPEADPLADPLADLKARLASLQTQSMSNTITTDRQVVEVGA